MKTNSDNIKQTLLLYENIEQLKIINKQCRQKLNNKDLKILLADILTFNEKLINIIEVYEKILFLELNETFEEGEG